MLAVCLAIVFLARLSQGDDAARALSFAALVIAFLMIILVIRSSTRSLLTMLRAPNPAMWWVVAGTGIFLTAASTLPPLQRLFAFAPLHAGDLFISLGAGFVCVTWFELLKRSRLRQRARSF